MRFIFFILALYTPFIYALNNEYSPTNIEVYNQLNTDLKTNKKQLKSNIKGINEAFNLFQKNDIKHPHLSDKYINIAKDITDKSKSKITDNIRKLHHDKKTAKIYYFVSFSMPESLLKTYLLDAIWTGGDVVIKGILPKYNNIYKFVGEKLKPLVYGKQMAAIQINPNLFEMYAIDKVPSIVVTQNNELNGCMPLSNTGFGATQACGELPKKSYYKISGNVETLQQLETIKASDCHYVDVFIKRLIKLKSTIKEVGFNINRNSTNWALAPMPLSKDQLTKNLQMIGLEMSGFSVGIRKLIEKIKAHKESVK